MKVDRPLFLFIEGVLNGFLLLVLPMLPVPSYLVAFIGLVVNLLVAYLIAETPSGSTGTSPPATQLWTFTRVWNRLRYWARPLFR